jgi:thiamine biosynthesis protein ThiS
MSDMIQIIFNGTQTSVLLATSVEHILQQGEQSEGKFLAVLNGEIIPKSLYASTTFKQGDEFETIVAISGG